MELSEIRTKIDAVDDQLLELFLQRMALSEDVAAYKNEHHLPILNKQREREILAKVTEKSGEKERYAYHLFSTLFELARSRQAELIDAPTKVKAQVEASLAAGGEVFPQTGLVACQGVEGANSQVACDRIVPRGNIVYVKTFQAVASAVESGLCKFGVLPIENSSNGSVRAVYELLQDHKLSVVRSTRLCIRHELLGLPGAKLSDITEIYSHEQAIGQCSHFLTSLNGVRVVPCDNTAVAAQMVKERGDKHVAATVQMTENIIHISPSEFRLGISHDQNIGHGERILLPWVDGKDVETIVHESIAAGLRSGKSGISFI